MALNSYTNPEPVGGVNTSSLTMDIQAASLPRPSGIQVIGGEVIAWFEATLDSGQQSTLTTTVAGHTPSNCLNRRPYLVEIDQIMARKLEVQTFTYNGNTFCLDQYSRDHWGSLYQGRASFTYTGSTQPRTRTHDGRTEVLMGDASDIVAHVEAMTTAVSAEQNAACSAKQDVIDALDDAAARAAVVAYRQL